MIIIIVSDDESTVFTPYAKRVPSGGLLISEILRLQSPTKATATVEKLVLIFRRGNRQRKESKLPSGDMQFVIAWLLGLVGMGLEWII